MRVMIDIVHPADALFYRNLAQEFHDNGHETLIVARDKDVTFELLDGAGLEYHRVGRGGKKGRLSLALELVGRVVRLVRLGRAFRPDIIIGRNPAGMIASRLLRKPGIFDTDDGSMVGIYWWAAVPFATIITTPESLTDDYRGKRRAYPGHKALAHLHPDRFTPDATVRDDLGLKDAERFFIVRFVAMTAHHDRKEAGLSTDLQTRLVTSLASLGKVFISSEAPLPPALAPHRFPLAPHRMHDALAFSSLLATDSQSMTSEAAILGVPTARMSSFVGRLPGLAVIANQYGLAFEYLPHQTEEFLSKAIEIAGSDDSQQWQQRRAQLLADKVDLTTWYYDLVISVVG